MKILHILPDLRKGGAERMAIDICHGLQQEGHTPLLLTFRNEHHYRHLTGDLNVETCRVRMDWHVLRAAEKDLSEFEKILKRFNPDVIHSHLFEAEFISREIRWPDAACFSHLHDSMVQFLRLQPATFLSRKRFTHYAERRHLLKQYRRCKNHFIANSAHTFDFFRKQLPGDLAGRLICLPNALRLAAFPYRKPLSNPRPFRLVTAGSLVEKKNHLFLIRLVQELQHGGMEVSLEILGEGPLRYRLEEEINIHALQNVVKLPGAVDDIKKHLWQAHLYVHAATYEPFGLSILEAMACGLPVVTLDGGGNREIIRSGANGFMPDTHDVKEFAALTIRLATDPVLYERLSRGARQTAEEHDMDGYIKQLILLYEQAVNDLTSEQ